MTAALAIGVLTEAQIRAIIREELGALLEQAAKKPAELPARLTVREAREVLRCTDRTVRRMIASGRLRSVKSADGGAARVLIPREDVEALLSGRFGGSL